MDSQLECIDSNLFQLFEEVEENVLVGQTDNNTSEFVVFNAARDNDVAIGTEECRTDSPHSDIFILNDLAEAETLISRTGQDQNVKFRKRKFPKNFGNTEWRSLLLKKKIFWDSEHPYIKASSDCCIYECHRGVDHDEARKKARKLNTTEKARVRKEESKKTGCQMKVTLEERIYFTKFQTKANPNLIRPARAKLKKDFETNPKAVEGTRKICLTFSGRHNHDAVNNEVESATKSPLTIDAKVVDAIHQLVWQGFDKTVDVRSALISWSASNRHAATLPNSDPVLPSNKDLANHIAIAKKYIGNLKNWESNLQSFCNDWRSSNQDDLLIFKPFSRKAVQNSSDLKDSETVLLTGEANTLLAFGKRLTGLEPAQGMNWYQVSDVLQPDATMPFTDRVLLKSKLICQWPDQLVLNVVTEGQAELPRTPAGYVTDPLLLVYQSKFQQDLLSEFGKQFFFLDEVCVSRRSHLNFFVVVVKTRQDFQPAGLIVSGLTPSGSSSLPDGLKCLFERSPNWRPTYCICSVTSETVPGLVEKAFPEIKAVVSDASRETAWNAKFARSNLDAGAKEDIRRELDNLANLSNVSNMECQIEKCRKILAKLGSEGSALKCYFETFWLAKPERWVLPFSCVKILARKKPPFFLDLDGEADCKISENSNFRTTRRLVNFQEVAESLIKGYFQRAKRRHLELVPEKTASSSSRPIQPTSSLIETLRQVLLVLQESPEIVGTSSADAHTSVASVLSNIFEVQKY